MITMSNDEFFKTAVIMRGRVYQPIDGCVTHDCRNSDTMQVEFTLDRLHSEKYEPKTHTLKDVIFNPPATIVFWGDGSKTVVKCQNGEPFDPEKGLAMAIMKKTYGNTGRYYEVVKEFTEKYYEEQFGAVAKVVEVQPMTAPGDDIKKVAERYMEACPRPEKPWKIWVMERNEYSEITSVTHTSYNYSSRASAVRRAKKLYGPEEGVWYSQKPYLINDDCFIMWRVAQENPFEDSSDK
jgi:hypothetical protein